MRVLVIVAHPDDAESFCGGTIARLTAAGHSVTLLVCTNGERGSHDCRIGPTDLFRLRQKEQDEAKHILGIQDVLWLGYRDGSLVYMTDLREQLIRIIRQRQPEVILTFDPWKHYEFHPDHRTVGFVATEARMLADLPWICADLTMEGISPWHPTEVYLFAPEEPNYWVDIGATLDLKIKARLAHRTQNDFICCPQDEQDFIQKIRFSAAGQGHSCGIPFAEAFHKVDNTDLCL